MSKGRRPLLTRAQRAAYYAEHQENKRIRASLRSVKQMADEAGMSKSMMEALLRGYPYKQESPLDEPRQVSAGVGNE